MLLLSFLIFLVRTKHTVGRTPKQLYLVWEVSPEDEEAILQVKKLHQLPTEKTYHQTVMIMRKL